MTKRLCAWSRSFRDDGVPRNRDAIIRPPGFTVSFFMVSTFMVSTGGWCSSLHVAR
jgi:hypothetical protein